MMLFIAAALASDGIARCTATLKTPDETLTVQAFAADFESGSLRVIEHAWLVADIDQHVDIYLGEVEVLVARYASIEPPDVPRVPGYEVRPGACEFVQVKRHSGDWDATWGDGYVTADLPWVALEAARRRKCFGDYQVAVGKGLPEARDALQVCLSKKATAPTPALRPLTEEIPTAPRFICVHEEGWVGGGVSLYEAREDALRAKVAGHSRETLGSVLAAFTAVERMALGVEPPKELAPREPLPSESADSDESCSGCEQDLPPIL